jgi:hypothetical protein
MEHHMTPQFLITFVVLMLLLMLSIAARFAI